MAHLYLFTLEIKSLEMGHTYDELPSHLTLMSRFSSDLSPEEMTVTVNPLFQKTSPITLSFGETVKLGPKKVAAHMVDSYDEMRLHKELYRLLGTIHAEFKYPGFIGSSHKAHVTKRESEEFEPGSTYVASVIYLVEVINKKRLVQAKFILS